MKSYQLHMLAGQDGLTCASFILLLTATCPSMLKFFPEGFSSLQLDIVGIVAILGEGSTSRNAQASALSWHHLLPRLYPAPQALLRHHQETRLPTAQGIVVGAQSGRIQNELNFFTQLLHHRELEEFEVELVRVNKKDTVNGKPAFGAKVMSPLLGLSVLGFLMFIVVIGLSIWQEDGPALIASLLLGSTSTTVGLASRWKLDLEEQTPNAARKDQIPLSDVVVFYPKTGAFRVIQCEETVSRLYFTVEGCKHYFSDNVYRWTALLSTVFLMGGLIMLGNAQPPLQMTFAACYILLNVLYWAVSALNPMKRMWESNFDVDVEYVKSEIIDASCVPVVTDMTATAEKKHHVFDNAPAVDNESDVEATAPNSHLPVRRKPTRKFTYFGMHPKLRLHRDEKIRDARSLTKALWVAIALTGCSRWARSTNIAPNTAVWDAWLEEAALRAGSKWSDTRKQVVPAYTTEWDQENRVTWFIVPSWDYSGRLTELLTNEKETTKRRHEVVSQPWAKPTFGVNARRTLKRLAKNARAEREQAKAALEQARLRASTRSQSVITSDHVDFAQSPASINGSLRGNDI